MKRTDLLKHIKKLTIFRVDNLDYVSRASTF